MIYQKVYKLKELCSLITDGAHSSPKEDLKGLPMFSVKDMRENGFDYTKVKRISIPDFDGLVKQGCQPKINDVLIAKDGSVLKHIFKVSEKPDYVLLSSIAILRPKINLVNPGYLAYILKSSSIIDHILTNFVSGSGVPRIVLKDFKEVEVRIPSLKEQEPIAEILSSLDDKIDLLHRNNRTLENMAEFLFNHLLQEYKNSPNTTLGKYVKVQGGYAFKSSDFQVSGYAGVIKIRNINFDFVDTKNLQYVSSEVVTDKLKKFRVARGSMLIAMTGAEIGKIGIVGNASIPLYFNQRVGLLLDTFRGSSLLGYLFLRSAEGQDHIVQASTGSAQENISSSGIESMSVPNIEISAAQKLCDDVQVLFDKKVQNLCQIETLIKLRDGLLPNLMSRNIIIKQ